MRDKQYQKDAEQWFKDNDIPLFGSNENPDATWTTSPKVFAHLYIDDMALGMPLKIDYTISNRPFVDWIKVRQLLNQMQLL
jgi:hypothetical protein